MKIVKIKTWFGWTVRHYITIQNNDETFQIYYDRSKADYVVGNNNVELKLLKSILEVILPIYVIHHNILIVFGEKEETIKNKSVHELLQGYSFDFYLKDGSYFYGYGQNKEALISLDDVIKRI